MTKKTLFTLFFILFAYMSYAQEIAFKFNKDSRFKIVQFTDVHYKYGKPESAVAIDLIKEVLDAEKPDLVVFTGDVVWAKPAKEALDEVFNTVVERKIPWAYIFGNHDDEFGMSRQEIMDYVSQKPYCVARAGDKSLDGVGNYILEVKDKKENKIEALLYFMDSKAYSKIKNVGHYDWFGFNQVNWYLQESAAYTAANKNKPYPALAFFHIPLAEYPLMTTAKDAKIIGEKRENECNGKLNSGMFAAMRTSGDVMGTFVGHDHDNDYIGEYYGLYLAYGRYSGGKTVYNNLGKNGCRIIELKEGKREFSTYIRLLGGETLYPVEYPKTFPIK
ncbi:metallophosphoesterase family protein [Dysgonomonas sp. BGC7]|uniref:metallophosphoesterase family protein n=1 Tax=Dysgonomonas sp. BGC7 TaxID=1658008 RepID=UPI0006815816|nr:metallophosphoesterase family protein [Dysgonomonas sp. BGC7]MBD8389548.1 metallophosphoesterase family protein [Dysgonomonas sp. BGC7]